MAPRENYYGKKPVVEAKSAVAAKPVVATTSAEVKPVVPKEIPKPVAKVEKPKVNSPAKTESRKDLKNQLSYQQSQKNQCHNQ